MAAEDWLPTDSVDQEFDEAEYEGLTCRTCGERYLEYKQLSSGKWWMINAKGEWHKHREFKNEDL